MEFEEIISGNNIGAGGPQEVGGWCEFGPRSDALQSITQPVKHAPSLCPYIIIYIYNDWLCRSDGLKEISKRVGITLINELENQNIALAKIE